MSQVNYTDYFISGSQIEVFQVFFLDDILKVSFFERNSTLVLKCNLEKWWLVVFLKDQFADQLKVLSNFFLISFA